jgi:hypothetical protein
VLEGLPHRGRAEPGRHATIRIVTSAPYNVGIEYSRHQDADPYEEYLDFFRLWPIQAMRVV